MSEKDCPHSQEIGALQAQLYSLKERVEAVEKISTDSANQILIGLTVKIKRIAFGLIGWLGLLDMRLLLAYWLRQVR